MSSALDGLRAKQRERHERNMINTLLWGLLAIAFVVLKLCGVIEWSWWWVLSPLWVPPVVIFLIVIVAIGVEAFKSGRGGGK